jgi:uncharacterized repeat protein (TIGR01451 family)
LDGRWHRRQALTAAATATGFNILTTYTVTGDLYVGNVVTLNLTITNVGTEDDPYGAFGWLILPKNVKRTNTPVGGNPNVLCEAYRGHQGGLSQAIYDDFCRVWYAGPIPAGGSLTLAFPVKLLAEGVYNTQAEMSWGVPDAGGYYPNIVRLSQDLIVAPAPPKTSGGGGTGSDLPDLQATAKASTGSPTVGSAYSYIFNVKNSGKVQANNIVFTATVPAGVTVASMLDGQSNTCTLVDRLVTCGITYLVPGQTGGITLGVQAPTTPGIVTMTGAFTAAEGDSNLTNNAATVSVTVK